MQKLILALFFIFLSFHLQAQKSYKFKSIKGKYRGIPIAYQNLPQKQKIRLKPTTDFYFKIGAIQTKLYQLPNPNNSLGGFVEIYHGFTRRQGDTISFFTQKKYFSTLIDVINGENKKLRQQEITSNKPMYRFVISKNEYGDIILTDINNEFIFIRMRDQRFKIRKQY